MSLLPTMALAVEHTDTKGHWGERPIDRWSDYGVVAGKGNGIFDPDGLMKRGEAAQVFANLFRLTAKSDLSDYIDVGFGKWYDDAIAKCVAAGILSGKGEGVMDPEGTITREEFFVMFARALGIEPETAAEVAVADGAQAASWAAGYITALVNRGYVKGTGAADGGVAVQPKLNINRASVMSLMDQTIDTHVNTTEKVTAGDGLTLIVVDNANVTFANGTESAEVYVFGNNAAITNAPVGTVVTTSDGATGTKVNGKAVSTGSATTVEKAKPSSGGSDTPPVLTSVEAPTAAAELSYNGTEQTGVAEATGYTVTNGKATNAGSYTATATLAAGYKWSDGTTAAKQIAWSIAKAALTATADDKTVTVGDEAPEYTVTYTGWVNGESIDTVTPTTPAVLACEYTTTSAAGDYAITFTTEPVFANYSETAVNGKLTAATWSVIGDFSDWASDVPMAKTETNVFVSPAITLTTSNSFKVRFGAAWDTN